MRKRLYIICTALSLLFAPMACDEYLDVNKNVDAPAYVDGYLYLAGIQQCYMGLYYDVRATGPLAQMIGTSALYFSNYAANTYPAGRDEGGEIWRLTYFLQGMNLENLIKQSEAAEEWTLAGIGYAIKAYSWDQLTKMHADLPLTDAYVPGLLSHDYDYQSEIYPKVREWAYKAIEYLQKEDASVYGTKISANDFIYGGDKAKWIKFSYGVIVRNLASLSNKTNFTTAYAQELIDAAGKSFATSADDATLRIAGGGAAAPYNEYNNFWGTARPNLSYAYFQHEYAVQVFTGTVPRYDAATGNKVTVVPANTYYPYELAAKQIICDTAIVTQAGHYDPRVAVKLGSADDANYNGIDNAHAVKKRRYYGGTFTSTTGPIGTVSSFYGRNASSATTGTAHDGTGRWIYRDNAPYILMTCAELKFCLAETYWKMNNTTAAFEAFKAGVNEDLDFTARYITPGTKGSPTGGDKITAAIFTALANQYKAGPFVNGLSMADFSLSHIMMQKWVALYPWGAQEAWVDMRKYHYDIAYTGEYPSQGSGAWSTNILNQKWDTDASKVYKGLYLAPAQVQGRKSTYNLLNEGSPCYRIRPRYNSEYLWNKPSLEALKPVSGVADNYQCSIPWFAYPGDLPTK